MNAMKGVAVEDGVVIDRSKLGRAVAAGDPPEVEGQGLQQYCECPHCQKLNLVEVSGSGAHDYFECQHCQRLFKS